MENPALDSIVAYVIRAPEGVSLDAIAANVLPSLPRRTLQRWLAELVDDRRLRMSGAARSTRYHPTRKSAAASSFSATVASPVAAPPTREAAPVAQKSTPPPAPAVRPTPAPAAPFVAAGRARRARSRQLQERFDHALPRALQRIMLTHLGPNEVASAFRSMVVTLLPGTAAERAEFIEYATEALRGLTEENRATYGIGEATFAEWRDRIAARAARQAALRGQGG